MKKNDSLKSIVVIIAICLFISVAMAAVNMVTAPIIEEENKRAEQEALKIVLPVATEFEALELGELPEGVVTVYRDTARSGYAVKLSIKGYDSSNPISAVVGFTSDGKITKCHIISCSGETSGIGTKIGEAKFLDLFDSKDKSLEGVDAISGATISSSAFIEGIKAAFEAVELAKEVG